MMIKHKTGQAEIMGLLIIVILVVMVMFIVILFNTAKQSTQVQTTYSNDQIGTSFILAFLDTSTECAGSKTFRDVISDCAAGEKLSCPSSSGKSCNYLNETIFPEMLNKTLNKWGQHYEFSMEHSGNFFTGYDNFTYANGCGSEEAVQRVSFQVIPLWPNRQQVVKVFMKVCKY